MLYLLICKILHQKGKMFLIWQKEDSFESFKRNIIAAPFPKDFKINEDPFHLYKIDFNSCPTIKVSIRVDENMKLKVFLHGKLLPEKRYEQYLKNGKVLYYSQFTNLLTFFETISENEVNNYYKIIEMLEDLVDENDEKNKQILFLIEQLNLINLPENSRRYSPSLLVFFNLCYKPCCL